MKLTPETVKALAYVQNSDPPATIDECNRDLQPENLLLWVALVDAGLVTVDENQRMMLTELGTQHMDEIPF